MTKRTATIVCAMAATSACGDGTEPRLRSYSEEVRADQPIAYWRYEETAGAVAADSSGLGRDGNYFSSPVLNADVGARTGRAVTFGNGADAMLIEGAWTNAPTLSVEAWVKPAQITSFEGVMIVDKGGSWNLIIQRDGRPSFHLPGLNESEVKAPELLRVDNTYHLVGVFTLQKMKLYVNGQLAAEGTPPAPLESQLNTPITVGGGLDPSRFEFSGTIDEVAIYDKELPAAVVLRHYNAGRR
jgi:concanavalin A-like lectin/glucanase superfamily protein